VNHIVLTLEFSCAANTGSPMRGKPDQRTPIPNLHGVLEQTSTLGQIFAFVFSVATNSEIEAWHFGRLILGLTLILEGLLVQEALHIMAKPVI